MVVGQYGATGPKLVVLSTGEHVPVVDVASRFGATVERARGEVPAFAVVIHDGESSWAFLADEVIRSTRVPFERVRALPEALSITTGGTVEALVDLGGECLPLLASRPGGVRAPNRGATSVEEESGSCASPDLVVVSAGMLDGDGLPLAFGVCATRVRAICTPPLMHHVPGLAPHVSGVSSWRGEMIPVIDLSVRFGFAPTPRDAYRLVVVRGPWTAPSVGVVSVTMPLVVRASETRLRLNASQKLEAPNWGVFESAGTMIIVPDLSRLFTKEELTMPWRDGGRQHP